MPATRLRIFQTDISKFHLLLLTNVGTVSLLIDYFLLFSEFDLSEHNTVRNDRRVNEGGELLVN